MTLYEKGQWECAEKLIAWINTLENSTVPKTNIYEWAMQFRPIQKIKPAPKPEEIAARIERRRVSERDRMRRTRAKKALLAGRTPEKNGRPKK